MTRARDLAAFVSNADGDIKFDTNTLFIDSSANHVGISDTTPENKLTVVEDGSNVAVVKARTSATDGRASYQIGNDADNWFMGIDGGNSDSFFISDVVSSSDRLVIDGSGNVGISDTSPTVWSSVQPSLNLRGSSSSFADRSGALIFKSQSGTYQTVLDFETGNDLRFFQSSNSGSSWTERLRLQSGGGISFNGDTAAANALSDYEEGTWTPTALQGASSISFSAGTPVYVKIGSLVHIQVYVIGTSGGNSAQLWIGGLPFTPIGSALNAGAVMYQNINLNTGRTNLVAYIPSNTSHIRLYQGGDNNAWYGTTGSDVGNSFNAIISISYRTSQ